VPNPSRVSLSSSIRMARLTIAVSRAFVMLIAVSVDLVHAGCAAATSACEPIRIALDTTYADTVVVADDSRGYGQVISVMDTLVSRVTFWRPAQPDTFPEPAVLYVTTVDSTGKPNVLNVLYVSPITGG